MKISTKPRRVAIIGTVGIPANYGGFETLADRLTEHLASNFDITVYCSSKAYKSKVKFRNKARLHYIPLKANGWQGILYDIWSIFHAIRNNDSLLILGVTGAIVLPFVKKFNTKTIVHIDGLEWRRLKWRRLAKWFLKMSEGMAIKHADEIILDNEVLLDVLGKFYPKRKYSLIAYGSETHNHGYRRHFNNGLMPKQEYAMALCRIVPENNIQNILDAFLDIGTMNLVFIGNWQINTYSRKLYQRYKDHENLDLRDPIYDQSKIEALRQKCKVYIHGHSAGGTNPSLVEAMRSGIPIIAKDVAFNRKTMKSEGLYFSETIDLKQTLNSIDDKHLIGLGKEMKRIAEVNYQWVDIARSYAKIFNS